MLVGSCLRPKCAVHLVKNKNEKHRRLKLIAQPMFNSTIGSNLD
jgi:hypothetical protein